MLTGAVCAPVIGYVGRLHLRLRSTERELLEEIRHNSEMWFEQSRLLTMRGDRE